MNNLHTVDPPTMIPELPYDIWCLIAKYIPKDVLLKLYGVNAAFFDIVMNQQYREVFIHHSKDGCAKPCLSCMGPVVLKRVQALEIRPHLYGKPQAPIQKSRQFERMTNHLNRERLKLQELAACQTQLQDRIEQMIQVTSLTVGCYPCNSLEMFNFAMPLYSTAWSAHGSRLTSLTLNIPVEAFPTVISTAPPFTALTYLHIAIHMTYYTTAYEETLVSIAGFIARHASTLTGLALDTPSPLIHPLHLFSNIPSLPHLTKLSLAVWLERLRPQYYTKVDQFLERQAATLTDLTLRFSGPSFYYDPLPAPDVFFSNPLFQVRLPYLKSLDIYLCRWPQELKSSVKDGLVQYLRRLSYSLTKLSIGRYVFTFTQAKDIVSVFSSEKSKLQSLEIQMHYLSCSLLDHLYKQLPRLQSLDLGFDSLVSREDGGLLNPHEWHGVDTRAASFVQDMSYRKYPNWDLRHLSIRPLNYCSGNWNECKPLLAAALPGVITFNDVSREEFTRIPNFANPQSSQDYYDPYLDIP